MSDSNNVDLLGGFANAPPSGTAPTPSAQSRGFLDDLLESSISSHPQQPSQTAPSPQKQTEPDIMLDPFGTSGQV